VDIRIAAWCPYGRCSPLAEFSEFALQDHDEAFTSLRRAEGIGRPLGTADFVIELERRLGRPIARRAPGRKATAVAEGEQLKLLQ